MKKTIVESICGNYPENFQKLDILSDPNFVFEPDAKYQTRKVWDIEGNSVFVNSFLECEHYVFGGWSYDPTIQLEISYRYYLLLIVASLFIFKILYKLRIKAK